MGFKKRCWNVDGFVLFCTWEPWYTDVTSQEDDKKVIKSEGHRARFDVTMLTNTVI